VIPDLAAVLPAPSARSMLITVLGELAFPDGRPVLTSTLLDVMRGLGIEDHAARQAIARSAAAGWMKSQRRGRAVQWQVAEHGREIVEDGMRRSAAFLDESTSWDGRWLMLLVSVPQEQRTVRKQLYGGLSWLGLGNPTPGVWVSPHTSVGPEVRELVAGFGLRSSSLGFVGATTELGMTDAEIVSSAWDLTDLAGRYATFLAQYGSLDPAPGNDTMLTFLQMLNLLQRFMRLDPRLPVELLPEWVGRDAAALIRQGRERWSAEAHQHWKDIVTAAG
jgi:phenylacetic acid degradation operon negative regulatory protein